MTEPADETPRVEHAPDRHRYEISLAGELAGFAAYRDRGEQRVFYHTEIDDAFAGHGLASILVTAALNDVRETGKRIVPVCPYVAKYLKKHDEFADLTDPVDREAIRWLREQQG
ncbi:GNAT family N-acetyltransferase [Streptomyces hainanensis]|uniref:N-acetyltransferase n=1 Tax=Streptomyces hainanensis TaxID=402648 RepID=A0A4R4ST33_9ACTN|nr:GNAT family N-acetyltransferase [Streptomyces hainanensis]TDC66286.1 N-acetyltransferase [Streptomyces hainanensis]